LHELDVAATDISAKLGFHLLKLPTLIDAGMPREAVEAKPLCDYDSAIAPRWK
jgi:hypothetical protein